MSPKAIPPSYENCKMAMVIFYHEKAFFSNIIRIVYILITIETKKGLPLLTASLFIKFSFK